MWVCSESGLPDDLSWGRLGYIRWLDTAQDFFHSKATHPLDHADFTSTISSYSTGAGMSVPVYVPVSKPLAVSANARHGISSLISSTAASLSVLDKKSGAWCDAPGLYCMSNVYSDSRRRHRINRPLESVVL